MYKRKNCKTGLYLTAIILCLLVVNTGYTIESDQENMVRPTPVSMDFYGYIKGAKVGDILTVYDPDGVLCGQYTISKPDQYGFLHVYGDDRSTDVDEGAEQGNELRFELNNSLLIPVSGDSVSWTGDKQKERVDFNRL